MPTVIDELTVVLGLDGSKFRGQADQTQTAITKVGRAAVQSGKALEETLGKTQTATDKRLRQTEEVGRQSAAQFRKFRGEVAALFSTLAAGFGFKKFILDLATADAGVGRLAARLNMKPQDLAAWQEATKLMGGSAEATGSAFLAMTNDFNNFRVTTQSEMLPWLAQLGVAWQDVGGNMRPMADIMEEIADSPKWKAMNLAEKNTFGAHFGMDPGLVAFLNKPKEQRAADLAGARERGVPDEDAVARAIALDNKLAQIAQRWKNLGRQIFGDFAPEIQTVLNAIESWEKANGPWLKGEVHDRYIEMKDDLVALKAHLDPIAEALGGWGKVIDGIGLLWLAKFTGMTTAAGTLLRMLALIPGSGVSTAALAALGIAGAVDVVERPFGNVASQEQEDAITGHEPAPPRTLDPDRGLAGWWGRMRSRIFGGEAVGGASDERKAAVRDKLAAGLGITGAAASGIVSNLNAESGIAGINEKNPLIPGSRGGFGWAQWTGPRRVEMESYARLHGMDPASDEANYGFLINELTTKPAYAAVLAQLRRGDISANEAAAVVAKGYIVPPEVTIPGHVSGAANIAKLPSLGADPTPGRQSSLDPSLARGLSGPAAPVRLAMNNNRPAAAADNSTSVETNINQMTIVTQAKDADGIARTIHQQMSRYTFSNVADRGLA